MRYLPLTILAAGAATAPALATQYLSPEQAQQLIFPEADAFKSEPLALDSAQMREVEQLSGLPARSVQWRVVAAFKGDTLLGHVVLDDVVGRSELISYAVGINRDASVRQVEILTYRESHGGEVRLPTWRKQFVGKTARGGGVAVGAGIDNISGATLSCTHVTDGVRRIAAIGQVALAK
jgi:Na+-transporting NADH:ubiquinone oxidoreductase subunit NqrC